MTYKSNEKARHYYNKYNYNKYNKSFNQVILCYNFLSIITVYLHSMAISVLNFTILYLTFHILIVMPYVAISIKIVQHIVKVSIKINIELLCNMHV